MKSNKVQVLILVAAGFVSSHVLLAQSDPGGLPASSTQPNQPGQQPAGTTSIQDSSTGPDATTGMMRDKAFIHKVGEGGLAEIQMGKLAAQKGNSPEVKALGQQMVDDHTEMNKQMAVVADTLGIRMPKDMNKERQAEYARLSGLSGDDFDKQYLTLVVKDHHQALREFRVEAMATTDSELHEALMKASMTIREHMMAVDKLARDKGVEVPGRKPNPAAQ
jgi:putative membrane protein